MDHIASGSPDDIPQVSLEIARLGNSFPFGAENNAEKTMDLLFNYLPSHARASSLCETYMEHGTWVFRPIKRDEIIDDIFAPIYKSMKERQATGSMGPHCISPHKLAVLFLVFALGALVDLTLEPCEFSSCYPIPILNFSCQDNAESETYFLLSRACLSLRSVFDSPEMTTVQAIVLMANYQGLCGKRYTLDSSVRSQYKKRFAKSEKSLSGP